MNAFEILMKFRSSIPPKVFQVGADKKKSDLRLAYEEMEDNFFRGNFFSKCTIVTPKGFRLSERLLEARNAQIRHDVIRKKMKEKDLVEKYNMTEGAIRKAAIGKDYLYEEQGDPIYIVTTAKRREKSQSSATI
jgi:hypothetical protein